MALQNTGSISLGDVNVELGNSRTTTINMGGSAVRGLFDRSSGECKLALHGRGKANTTWYGDRGLFGGGNYYGGVVTAINYIDISTTGNASDFGDLTTPTETVYYSSVAGASNGTRGVWAGKKTGTNCGRGGCQDAGLNYIDYITISTTGNASDFGDLTVARYGITGCSDGTKGIFAGGNTGNIVFSNVIDYVTIASTGNASDFGDLTTSRSGVGACANSSRAIFAGGNPSSYWECSPVVNTMDYVTPSTTGNASDFGDLTVSRAQLAGCGSDTRAVFAGGLDCSGYNASYASRDVIDYVTISSTGNASDFGDLVNSSSYGPSGASNNTRAVFAGALYMEMAYITIASTGNASDFGDLVVYSNAAAGISGD